MAVWQFDIQFVRTSQQAVHTASAAREASRLSRSDYEVGKSYFRALGLTEQRVTSDWIVFGDPKGNRFDLCLTDNSGAEISARIDASDESDQFCTLVCLLAIDLECELWATEVKRVLKPDKEELLTALRSSDARQYARDPSQHSNTRGRPQGETGGSTATS